MRIKTNNKRKSKKHNLIKNQTSSKISKCCSLMDKRHFDIEACRSVEIFKSSLTKEMEEIKEIK